MRLVVYSFPISKGKQGWWIKGQHTGARWALHLKDIHNHYELTDRRLLRIMTDNASSNYSMTHELQSTLEASAILWPASRNHIRCLADVIQLASGAFMSTLGVKDRSNPWEAHERDQHFGENECIDIGKSQRLREEGKARISNVSAMEPGLAKIIEKVRLSWYVESPEIDHHIAENSCGIDYADTWSSNRVHWVSKSEISHCCTADYGCEDMVQLNTGVARARLPITEIHTRLAGKSKIHWLPATFHNSRWVDHCEVCHGNIEVILILDSVDVKEAYSDIASCYLSVQWHVPSYGWHNASFGYKEDSIEGRLVLRCEVSSTEAVQILRWSDSNDWHASHFCSCLNPFRKLRSFRQWDKGMDIHCEDETSYTTQYQVAFLTCVEKEYCGKHRHVPVNMHENVPSSNLIPSATASVSCQSSFDPNYLSTNDEECLTPNNGAEMTTGRSDLAACSLTAARLHLNSRPDAPKNWGQINSNLNEYHSDPKEIWSTFWLQGITRWLCQLEKMHWKYAHLSNVARVIFSIIPHGVWVEASSSLGQDVIGWR